MFALDCFQCFNAKKNGGQAQSCSFMPSCPVAFSTRARVNTPAKPKKSPIRHQPHHNKSAIFPAVLLSL
jgi:hypothetical protein